MNRLTNLVVAGVVGVVMVCATVPVAAQEQVDSAPTVLTLKEALTRAREYSHELKAARERIAQAQSRVSQAWTTLLPFISATGNYMRADQEISIDFGSMGDLYALALANCIGWDEDGMGPRPAMCDADMSASADSSGEEEDTARVIQDLNNWDASLNIGMSLINLRSFPLMKAAYASRELEELKVAFSEEALLFAVVQMYYGVSTAQVAGKLLAENLANTMRHLEFSDIRLKAGVALANERVRAAMSVVQARAALDRANEGIRLAKASMAIMLGMDEAVVYRVEEFPEHPYVDEVVSVSDGGRDMELLLRRKDVLMMDKVKELSKHMLNDSKLKFLPNLRGAFSYGLTSATGFSGEHSSWRLFLTLNWSILEGGRRFYEVGEARAKEREAAFNREATIVRARTEVEKARSGIHSARIAVEAAAEMLGLAKENLDIVEKQYKLGAAQQTVILDAQSQHRSAQFQALQGKLQLALAQVALARVLGVFNPDDF